LAFSDNLKFFMMVRDMSQKTFAERIGRSQASVSEWMTGKTSPQLSLLPKIAKVLGVRPSDLIDESRPRLTAYMDEPDFREAVKLIAEGKRAYNLSDAWAEKMMMGWAKKWGMNHLLKQEQNPDEVNEGMAAHSKGPSTIGGAGFTDPGEE